MARVLVCTAFLFLAAAFVGCDPAIDITFENRSPEVVLVSARGNVEAKPFFDEVQAEDSRTLAYLSRNIDRYRIHIYTEQREVLLDEIYTVEEIDEFDRHFIVYEDGTAGPAGDR